MHNLFHVVPEMKDTIEVSGKAPAAKGDSKLYSNVNFICQDIDAAASLVSVHMFPLSIFTQTCIYFVLFTIYTM